MFQECVYLVGRVISPVLIHFLASNLVAMIGQQADAALRTSATAVLLLPLFLWMYRKDSCLSEREAHIKGLYYPLLALAGVGANYLLTLGVNWLITAVRIPLSNQVQEALFHSGFWVQLTGIGILVPLMEEVLFRGLVYRRLRGYTKHAWIAVLLSAAIFAAYHGNVIQMLFAFPMGVLLALIYEKWDTIWGPVVFHAAVNLSSILWTAIG